MGFQDQVQWCVQGTSCGMHYRQVTSVDFFEDYSLVVNDITFHILLLMVLHFGYLAKMIDIETAFLYRDLEEEIRMECPLNISKDECIILNKCIYGFVQAARQYCKKAVKILRNSGFVGGSINPCLYSRKV